MSKKRNKHQVVRLGFLAFSTVTLLATVGACGRTAASNEQQLLELAAKASTRLKAQNGGAADSLTKRNAEATEQLLRGLIDKEREERMAADKLLSDRIDVLENELKLFKEQVNARFAAVDKRDAELRGEMTSNFDELRKVDKELAARIEEEAKKRAEELAEVRKGQADLEKNMVSKMEAAEQSFTKKLADQKAALESAMAGMKTDLSAQISATDQKLKEATEENKAALQKQKDELEARLTNIETAAANEKARLDRTVADMDAMRKSLEEKISTTNTELEKAKKDLEEQLKTANDAQRIALETNVKRLEGKVADLGDEMKRENMALAAKQADSEKKIASLDGRLAEETKARTEAMAALKAETEALIKKTDSKTQSELRSLISQVEQASASNLETVQKQLLDKLSKQDADTRLELLNLTGQIASVSAESKKSTADLEKRMLSNIENVRTELSAKTADLSSALAAARTELSEKISSGLASVSDDFSEKLKAAESRLSENLKKEIATQRMEIEGLKVGLKNAEDKFAADLAAKGKELEGKLSALNTKVDTGFQDVYSRHMAETLKNQETAAALSAMIAEQQAALAASESQYNTRLSSLQTSQETALADALKAEREERVKELQKLNTDMTTLKTAQDTARSNLEKELKDNLAAMNNKSAEEKAAMELRIAELNGALTDLDASTFATMKDLKDALVVERQKTEQQLASAVQTIEGKLNDAAAETQKVAARVEAVNRAQEEFKAHVAQTYATKGELEAIALRVEGLEFVTKVMNADMVRANSEIKAMISTEVSAAKDALSKRIGAVEASVDGVKNQLGGAIDDYKKKINELSSTMNSEITKVKTDMKSQDDALFAKISDSQKLADSANADLMEKLKKQAVNFEALSQGIKKELSDKMTQLDGQIASTNTDLQLAKLETQKKFAETVQAEQAFKSQLAKDLAALKGDLEKTAKESSQALALANTNAETIKVLRADFEDHKTYAVKKFGLIDADMAKVNESIKKMQEDFNKELEKVNENAKEMVSNLGDQVKENFAKVTSDIAKLKVAQRAQSAKLTNVYAEMFKLDWDNDLEEFSQLVASDQDEALVKKEMRNGKMAVIGKGPLVRTLLAFSEARKAFQAALAPRQRPDGGERVEFYDKSFVPLMVQCGGNAQATFANAFGRDSFDFLADEFLASLISGPRGTPADVMYLKNDKLTDGDSLHHYIMIESIRNLEAGADDPKCMSQIKAWANEVINSKDFQATRDKIAKNADFQGRIAEFVAASNELRTAADKIERRFAARIAKDQKKISRAFSKMSSPEKTFGANVKVEDKAIEMLAGLANALTENADATFDAIERQADFDKMVDMQRQFAKAMKDENAEDAEVIKAADIRAQKMEARIKTLEDSLAKFNNMSTDVANLKGDVGNMKNALSKTLDVVMSLAIRAGHPDLVDATKEAGKFIGYTPQEIGLVKPKILEIQHFFTGSAQGGSSDTCSGSTIKRGAGVKFWTSHGGQMQCWVNFRGYRAHQWASVASGIWFRVFGAAQNLQVYSRLCGPSGASSCNAKFNYKNGAGASILSGASSVSSTMHGAPKEGVFDVRLPNILDPYMRHCAGSGGYWDWCWWGEEIQFVAEGSQGQGSVSSGYRVQMFSPIVLDFLSIGRPLLSSSESSRVKFDLDADGRAERTGWLAGNREMGFLALDLNGNGQIDNGAELFGEGTKMRKTGKKARDGYAALAQYDSNRDGFIDSKDAIYKKLVVWFDSNQDGRTNEGEIVKLADSGVTKVALKHEKIDDLGRFVNGNEIRTQAKFWGPRQCGSAGCASYDVYFGAGFMLSHLKTKK